MLELERDFPLARMTTVRTGGNAELFARVTTTEELRELLELAAREGLAVQAIGSGSNLLVADEGVRGAVVQLAEESWRGPSCSPTASSAAAARAAEHRGARGCARAERNRVRREHSGDRRRRAVRMNANAYGGALADVLEWVEVVTVGGVSRRGPHELGLAYRSSGLAPGEIIAAARFVLRPAPVADVKATLAQMRARRHAAQPKGIKTFGSTFKNPPGGSTAGELLAGAGLNGLRVGGARLSLKHANFVENLGGASTAEIVELMARARAIVLEREGIALEREVQVLGPVSFPWEAR